MQKSDIAGLTYRSKDNKVEAYSGTKRVASDSEKSTVNSIFSQFIAAVKAKH
jgi:hypothetical protein|tara:strand:- start:1399 stop:1554 length:156 start_codon:yes stop_codon:yes gene_type:complete